MQRAISLILLIAICSCSGRKTSLRPTKYLAFFYASDNANSRRVELGNVTYLIKLITPECLAAREATLNGNFSEEKYVTRLNPISQNLYFIVNVTDNSQAQEISKEAKLSYYMNEAVKNISLSIDEQSIPAAYVNYEDYFGLKPSEQFLVCFNVTVTSVKGIAKLTYNDQLLSNPNISCSFTRNEISALPNIKF